MGKVWKVWKYMGKVWYFTKPHLDSLSQWGLDKHHAKVASQKSLQLFHFHISGTNIDVYKGAVHKLCHHHDHQGANPKDKE